MRRTVVIDPVTRIEGHARVILDLDERGMLDRAALVVNELRGFERILAGMGAERMPQITARICGICPSAHHLAAAKALDASAGVEPPPAGALLRELLYAGHFIHSHSLSLFVLEGPDLFMDPAAPPEARNIAGMARTMPQIAGKALRCRSLGQKLNELVGGRGIHPVTAVPGGITVRLDGDQIRTAEAWLEECLSLVQELAATFRDALQRRLDNRPELLRDWVLPVWSAATVRDGALNLYDGTIKVVDETGRSRYEGPARDYSDWLVEIAAERSYMKPVRFRDGGTEYAYRVGPLARLNVADSVPTELAGHEFAEFRRTFGRPAHQTVVQCYARLIEVIYAIERGLEILRDPALDGPTRVPAKLRAGRFVGHVEAPRGTLIHDYEIDESGIVRKANLVVATQQNATIIDESIRQACGSGALDAGDEQLLNTIEFAIRCYDPCLSCATHALGRMPIELIVRRGGEVVRRARRSGDAH